MSLTDKQTNRQKKLKHCLLAKVIMITITNYNNNDNKVDVQFPQILVRKLHTQACEIVVGRKRKLCKKFLVNICKTKKR